MEPISSGTTMERIIRTSILTFLLVIYAVLSFKDGYYSYPKKNVLGLVQNLTPVPKETPAINQTVSHATVREIIQSVQNGKEVGFPEVQAQFGEPAIRQGDASFYFGPGGLATFKISETGQVLECTWKQGQKTEGDLFVQIVIGAIVGVLGLLMLVQFLRVVTTRVRLSDAGLKVNSQGGLRFGGTRLVPLEAIVGLESPEYKKKGWVQINYQLDDGTEGTVQLNDYVHKAFPQIINELCQRYGFDNPIAKETTPDEEPSTDDATEQAEN